MSGIQSKNTLHSKKQENAIYNEINQSIKTDLEIIQLRERKDKGIVKKEKEMHASFAVLPQTAKVIVTMHDKCLIKMEKIF